MTTLFGITTLFANSKNPCRMAELVDYPIPLLLTYDDCQAYIDKYYPNQSRFNPKIETERAVWVLVRMMVECNSGRRIVSNGNMIVVDESRATYEELYQKSSQGLLTGTPWKIRMESYLTLYRERIKKANEPTWNRKPVRPKIKRTTDE